MADSNAGRLFNVRDEHGNRYTLPATRAYGYPHLLIFLPEQQKLAAYPKINHNFQIRIVERVSYHLDKSSLVTTSSTNQEIAGFCTMLRLLHHFQH